MPRHTTIWKHRNPFLLLKWTIYLETQRNIIKWSTAVKNSWTPLCISNDILLLSAIVASQIDNVTFIA